MSDAAAGIRYLTAATIAQKVFSFAFFTWLSYRLGVAGTGDFVWAMAFTSIFGFFVDWGLAPAITRFVSGKNPDELKGDPWLAASWSARLVSAFAAYGVAVGAAALLGYGGDRLGYVAVSGLVMVGDSFITWASAVWRGRHDLRHEAFSILAYQAFVAVVGGIILFVSKNVYAVLASYALASMTAALYLHVRLWHAGLWKPTLAWRWQELWRVVEHSKAIILSGALIRAYNYFDTLLVDRLAGSYQLGLYALANKLVLALQFLPNTFAAKYYAVFSREFHNGNITALKSHFSRFLFVAATLGCGVALLLYFATSFVIDALYPQFAGSLPLVWLLALSLPAAFVNFPLGSLLNAMHRSGVVARNLGIVLALNVIADVALVPTHQAIAAAAVASACNWILVALNGSVIAEVLRGAKAGEAETETAVERQPWLALAATVALSLGVGLLMRQWADPIATTLAVGFVMAAASWYGKLWRPFERLFFEDYRA